MSNKIEDSDTWFTVTARFDRESGALEVNRPYIEEVRIQGSEFVLIDREGEETDREELDKVKWYRVKPQKKTHQPEHGGSD